MPVGTSAWTALANLTLSSSQTTINFTSIQQTYKDLVLIVKGSTNTTLRPRLTFNSNSSSNYRAQIMKGNGGSANAANVVGGNLDLYDSVWDSTESMAKYQILDYANSSFYKPIIASNDNRYQWTIRALCTWEVTSAITSIQVIAQGGSFNAGTTFTLYGVAA